MSQSESAAVGGHVGEPHNDASAAKLNWLRAAVLGANDGVVSVAGMVMGVAGASSDQKQIFVAGVAGLAAGALSMGTGEYVSVSTQRDTERALLAKEKAELADYPDEELRELAGLYQDKGLSPALAIQVARELTEKDAFGAHAEVELGINPDDLANPWHAAFASMGAFIAGAVLPLLLMTFLPPSVRVLGTVIGVLVALAITGVLSAQAGGAKRRRALLRNVLGGLLAMGVTYLIGHLIGSSLG